MQTFFLYYGGTRYFLREYESDWGGCKAAFRQPKIRKKLGSL